MINPLDDDRHSSAFTSGDLPLLSYFADTPPPPLNAPC